MDLKLDSVTKDIQIVDGNPSLTSGIDAIRQHLQMRMSTFRGEWFLDPTVGVPYFDDVFKKNPDLTILNAVFTKAILDTPGVVSLTTLSFDLQTDRSLVVTFQAVTTDGVLSYSGLVGV
jgi:hypothetical protein